MLGERLVELPRILKMYTLQLWCSGAGESPCSWRGYQSSEVFDVNRERSIGINEIENCYESL